MLSDPICREKCKPTQIWFNCLSYQAELYSTLGSCSDTMPRLEFAEKERLRTYFGPLTIFLYILKRNTIMPEIAL